MQQGGDPLFIDMLSKIRIGETDDNSETMPQSSFRNNQETDYPTQDLHVFAENVPVSIHNDHVK